MAYQSIWYFTDLPEKVVDLIAEDLTDTFDPQMMLVLPHNINL
jgi:hypothetical protein